MAAAVSAKVGVKVSGTTVQVPKNDTARLMYYMRCVTLHCGMDIVQDDLVDFKNWWRLSEARKDMVFLAAIKYSPDEMLGKTLFIDDDGDVCGPTSMNKFVEITKNVTLIAAQSSVIIAGEQKIIESFMACKSSWLQEFYLDPIKRNTDRIQMAYRRLVSSHCAHCAGKPSQCACRKCPRKDASSCSPSVTLTGTLAKLFAQLETPSGASVSSHCRHCEGKKAFCACLEGCDLPDAAECVAIHRGIQCDSCKTSDFTGSRLKCRECDNYDLCGHCYKADMHIISHAFVHIPRAGRTPIPLKPRMSASSTPPKPVAPAPVPVPDHHHTGIKCDVCQSSPVIGMRFKCGSCENFNMCASCYNRGMHDLTHPFVRMEKRNGTRTLLQPREKKDAAAGVGKSGKPAAGSSGSGKGQTGRFYDSMSVRELREFLRVHEVSANGLTDVDDLRERVWHVHCDSIGLSDLNECIGDLGLDASGCNGISDKRELVKRAFVRSPRAAHTGFNVVGGGEAGAGHGYCDGDRVALINLKATSMNGLSGIVVNVQAGDGRLTVQLDSGKKVNVKPSNLQADAEDLD